MLRRLRQTLICATVTLLSWKAAFAADLEQQQQWLNRIGVRLLAVTEPVEGYAWPPKFRVVESFDGERMNAFASVIGRDADDKPIPGVTITSDFIALLCDDAESPDDRLALTVGHELGHIIHRHILTANPTGVVVSEADQREREIQSDLTGLKLCLDAGYSRTSVLEGARLMNARLSQYNGIEALVLRHPCWVDRLAELDQENRRVWRSLSAFRMAETFMGLGQFKSAEACYLDVLEEFPDAAEVLVNLANAELSRYLDSLQLEDLQAQGITGRPFGVSYRRSRALEADSNAARDDYPTFLAWSNSIVHCKRALRIDPSLTLAKLNLGVAYLVAPSGADAAKALELFKEIGPSVGTIKELNDVNTAMRYQADLTTALVAAGDSHISAKQIRALRENFSAVTSKMSEGEQEVYAPWLAEFNQVMIQQEALLCVREGSLDRAESLFLQFLVEVPRNSKWWALGHANYLRSIPSSAANKAFLDRHGSRAAFRPVTSLSIPDAQVLNSGKVGVEFNLGMPAAKVMSRARDSVLGLGPYRTVQVGDTNRLNYVHLGRSNVQLLVGHSLAAICLNPGAPAVTLRAPDDEETITLTVGAAQADVEGLLGNDAEWHFVLDDETLYRCYPALGLSFKFDRDRMVEQIVISRL